MSKVDAAPLGQALPLGGETELRLTMNAPWAGGGTGSLHDSAPRATAAVTHQRDDRFILLSSFLEFLG
jgi:hypothetical protein